MEQLEYMHGGSLGIALLGADIHSIHPVMPGEALCSIYAKCHGTLSVKTEPSTGVRRGSFICEGKDFRFTDFIHPTSPIFVRRIECFSPISFGISTPPEAHRRLFRRKEDPSMLVSSVTGNICITLRGGASFSPDGCIAFGTGKSEMIVCSLSGDRLAGLPGVPPHTGNVYESVMEASDPRLNTAQLRDIASRTCHGGILHNFADCIYDTEEQYKAIKMLCSARLFMRARDVIEFMHRIYASLGHLPAVYGERPVSDPFPSIRNLYLTLALWDYYKASKDRLFTVKILPIAAESAARATEHLKDGHLPHLGDEGVYGKELFLHSDKSEALFTHAAAALKSMSKELNVRLSCAGSLRSALRSMQNPSCSLRRPTRALNTVCEECERQGVCYLGKQGRYLCPQCYIE